MLLVSEDFTDKLRNSLTRVSEECLFCSAFIKLAALEYLAEEIKAKELKVRIVCRWRKQDLISGASDLEIYTFCQSRGWEFGINQNYHGKLYLLDNKEIYLGSANLTQKGLGLTSSNNIEFGTIIRANDTDIDKVHSFLENEITWVNNELFNLISEDVKNSEFLNNIKEAKWPEIINDKIISDVYYLWVQELPFVEPARLLNMDFNDEQCLHDFELLALDIDDLTPKAIASAFIRSKGYFWLKTALKKHGSLNFGGFSCELHDSFLDNPKPYRKEVKEFVAILLEWANYLPDTFKITQHRHTKSLSLV